MKELLKTLLSLAFVSGAAVLLFVDPTGISLLALLTYATLVWLRSILVPGRLGDEKARDR